MGIYTFIKGGIPVDVTFTSEHELYDRIIPALRTKKEEMRRNGYSYIKEEDIWNYLKEVKWKQSKGLELCEMVSDVLNTEEVYVDRYLREKLNLNTRSVYFNE